MQHKNTMGRNSRNLWLFQYSRMNAGAIQVKNMLRLTLIRKIEVEMKKDIFKMFLVTHHLKKEETAVKSQT